jgi:hypothetical protein
MLVARTEHPSLELLRVRCPSSFKGPETRYQKEEQSFMGKR